MKEVQKSFPLEEFGVRRFTHIFFILFSPSISKLKLQIRMKLVQSHHIL